MVASSRTVESKNHRSVGDDSGCQGISFLDAHLIAATTAFSASHTTSCWEFAQRSTNPAEWNGRGRSGLFDPGLRNLCRDTQADLKCWLG